MRFTSHVERRKDGRDDSLAQLLGRRGVGHLSPGEPPHRPIELEMAQEAKAELGAGDESLSVRLKNAVVGGSNAAFNSVVATALFTAQVAPTVLLWGWLWRCRIGLFGGVLRGSVTACPAAPVRRSCTGTCLP